MNASASGRNKPLIHKYPPGFRAQRGINWGYLGLLYTSFYTCRYNLSLANKSISDEFGYTKGQMGNILFAWLIAYAFGQIINGLLTDRMGGKRAMLIGAVGTITMNILFGAASFWGMLGLFIAIRGIDGYLQSFGAPGMTKIKTAWFPKRERGGFAGIFGFMINLGRFGIFTFGPALLAGFTVFGMVHVSPLHWRWLFWGPSIVCAVVALFMALNVKETPEEHGYLPVEQYPEAPPDRTVVGRSIGIVAAVLLVVGVVAFLWWKHFLGTMDVGVLIVVGIVMIFILLRVQASAHATAAAPVASDEQAAAATRADLVEALRLIVTNPAVWIVALAYACTGSVRQVVDQWFPRYMQEVHHTDLQSAQFQFLAFLIPAVASAGSLLSGYISDKLFAGQRAPVAAALYAIETLIIFLAAQFHTANAAVFFFVLISFTANSTHSILGTAAAMDIGGRKMSGFASGVIDSFQYFGGSLAIWILSPLLDKSWGYYFYFMVPFALLGCLLMVFGNRIVRRGSQQ